jgi:sarcosine oxidase, subunit beta
MTRKFEVVICGAGITGISAAFHLAKAGVRDILLLDEGPPMSLTSDRSTECYRNWWPDAEMLALMNRSIDLMEQLADESGNVFRLNRRGYLYVTADKTRIDPLIERSTEISNMGGGAVRIHSTPRSGYKRGPVDGFHQHPIGADLLLGNELIRAQFPYLTRHAAAALHVRRAGWLSAQQMGMYLFEAALRMGARFESAKLVAVEVTGGRVSGVELGSGEHVACPVFVNAAGPFLSQVGQMLGIDIPVFTELHLKASFKDHLGIVGREAPLLIWDDPQLLEWGEDERAILAEDPETRWLTDMLPGGAHTRPEGADGSQTILLLWEYKSRVIEPLFPILLDEQFPEIALRGMSAMLPGLSQYYHKIPRPQLDGGYYTKTRENRPLVGPLPIQGSFVIGGVSGYGIMSAPAAGELLAGCITGQNIPRYASAFALARYEAIEYVKKIEAKSDGGQL